jgi:hypothetical protein
MLRRIVLCVLAAVALLVTAAGLWLPLDFAPRIQAEPQPEPPSSESKLIAGECALFVTVRPRDFTNDELLKAALQEIPDEIARELRVPLAEVERVTFVMLRGGMVRIVHTRKAYDRDKTKAAFTEDRFGFKDKGFKDGAPRQPAANEKKFSGKTVYYAGDWQRWTEGFCPIDRTTFMAGNVRALENLLKSKAKASPEMTAALALGGSHSLVLGLDGKRLAAVLKQERQDRDRDFREMEKRRFDKEKGDFKDGFKDKDEQISVRVNDRVRRAQKDKVEKEKEEKAKEEKAKDDDDDLELFDNRGPDMVAFLPYKPLLKSRFALLTFDVKKTYTLKARVTVSDKDELDDAETALKSLLYVIREMAKSLPKQESEFKGLMPLSVPVQKAFKAAKVERKDNTLSTSVTLTPEAGLAKKVRDSVAEHRKNRFADKDRPLEFKDKKKE